MTTKPFFVATVDMFQAADEAYDVADPEDILVSPDDDTVGYAESDIDPIYELTWGAVPWGSISMDVEPTETTGTLYLSDDGYTTKSTDAGGVVVYPPKIAASFGIDRQIPLPPGDGAGSWSFGSLEVTDTDDAVSSLLRSWNIDAQNVTISRGVKTFENFQGYRSARQTKGSYINVDGNLTYAAIATVRWDYSTGTRTLLNEAAGTNYIPNPRAEGAAAGTPGTAPTGWTINTTAGPLVRSIVGIGTENGIPYIDVRWAGTTVGALLANITPINTTTIAAAVGETWTHSSYVKLVGGTLTGIVYSRAVIVERGGSTEPTTVLTYTATTADLAAQRKTFSRTFTVSNTAFAQTIHQFSFAATTTIDVTFRIGGIQLEKASAATSLILPEVGTLAVTSRDMERLYTARNVWTSPALASLETVFTGVAGTWIAADRSVVIPIRDISYWLERPIQSAVYGGTGTYDGTAELAGVTLPKLRGKAYNIAPVLIDPTNLIYQYNDAAGTVVALYERGATGASGIVFQANTTDLYTGTTTAGQYRTDNSRGLFQLGSPPVGQITLTATGQFPAAGNITNLASIARYLQSEDAAVPSGFMNTTSYSDAATAYPYAGGIYIAAGSGMTARAAVAYVMASFAAKMIVGRDGRSTVLALRAASLSATPTAAINEYTAKTVRPIELPSSLSPPPYRIRVAYQHNYTIQTDASELATDTHREFIAQADRFKSVSNAAILAAYRRPNDLPPFGGGLDSATDAATVASDVEALWCTSRSAYLVTVPMEVGLGLDLGQTVLLTWPSAFLRLGQRGLIVSEQFRSQEDITFMVLV